MVAMLFIIICHIFQTYGNELAWWFNVGVQIFLIISGYLYCNKDYSIESPLKIIKKQFKKILLPYYLWLPIVIILYSIVCPQDISIKSIINYILCCGTIEGQGQFWFIPYILFCYIITPYLYFIKEYIKGFSLTKSIISVIIIIICIIILSSAFNSYFSAPYIVCYVLGYYTCDIFSRFKNEKLLNIGIIFIFIVTIIFNGLKIYLTYINPIQLNGIIGKIYNNLNAYAHVLLGLTIFITLLIIPNIKYNKILSFSDNYSYHIFIVHALFIRSSFHLLYATNYIVLNVIIATLCTIIAGIFFKKMSNFLFIN